MAFDPKSIIPNFNVGRSGPAGTPRYGAGPGNLGMRDVMGLTGMPAPNMGYPALSPSVSSMISPAGTAPAKPSGGVPAPELDFSAFGNGDVAGTPQGPSGPAPSTPVQGNPLFSFLSSLFGRSGGSAPQGMSGLLARGQGAPGTNSLGNPFNRF